MIWNRVSLTGIDIIEWKRTALTSVWNYLYDDGNPFEGEFKKYWTFEESLDRYIFVINLTAEIWLIYTIITKAKQSHQLLNYVGLAGMVIFVFFLLTRLKGILDHGSSTTMQIFLKEGIGQKAIIHTKIKKTMLSYSVFYNHQDPVTSFGWETELWCIAASNTDPDNQDHVLLCLAGFQPCITCHYVTLLEGRANIIMHAQ